MPILSELLQRLRRHHRCKGLRQINPWVFNLLIRSFKNCLLKNFLQVIFYKFRHWFFFFTGLHRRINDCWLFCFFCPCVSSKCRVLSSPNNMLHVLILALFFSFAHHLRPLSSQKSHPNQHLCLLPSLTIISFHRFW